MKDPLCETLCLKILVALYVELNAVEILAEIRHRFNEPPVNSSTTL